MNLTDFKKSIKHIAAPDIDVLADYNALVAEGKIIEAYKSTDKRRKVAFDMRTFKSGNEYHIYPIANVCGCIYIICPLCGEIHTHGSSGGYRVPHCKKDARLW